jgi:hypothetical protein
MARLSVNQIAREVLLLCTLIEVHSWVSGAAQLQAVFHLFHGSLTLESGWQASLDRFTSI